MEGKRQSFRATWCATPIIIMHDAHRFNLAIDRDTIALNSRFNKIFLQLENPGIGQD